MHYVQSDVHLLFANEYTQLELGIFDDATLYKLYFHLNMSHSNFRKPSVSYLENPGVVSVYKEHYYFRTHIVQNIYTIICVKRMLNSLVNSLSIDMHQSTTMLEKTSTTCTMMPAKQIICTHRSTSHQLFCTCNCVIAINQYCHVIYTTSLQFCDCANQVNQFLIIDTSA